MRSHRSRDRWHTIALIASLALIQPDAEAQIWQQSGRSSNPDQLQWSVVDNNAGPGSQVLSKPSTTPQWRAVEPSESIDVQAELKKPAAEETTIYPPSGTTFANDKALWRDEQWHPQISSLVPVGFGPQGVMLTGGLYGWDCTSSGICTRPNDWDDYKSQLEEFGEAQYDASIGFGDAEKYFGITVSGAFEETNLSFGDRNTNENKNIFSNYYIGAHLSRNIGPDTALQVGVKNWLDVKECGLACGFPKSAYGVISQRIRLNPDQHNWFPNAYLTAGVGNGEFRPLDERVKASIAAQRAADCQTHGFVPEQPCSANMRRRAVLDAANYGQLTPIGAAAVEVYPGFNAIGEWSGRNLNLGFSVRPFDDFGLVLTSMWNNLIQNCDYGCDISVPGKDKVSLPENMITYRPIWSFSASINLKF